MVRPLDRISPTQRPDRKAQGLQKWRHLLFVHWEVPVEALRALVPSELTVDTFEGRAFVGLVPFTMLDVRPLGFLPPPPFAGAFHETNVRTYVHKDGEGPGVWFFSLEAASSLAVIAARAFFHLPYFRARMELEVERESVRYRSERLWPKPVPASVELAYEIGDVIAQPALGSFEFFLAERYLLYARRGDGTLFRGRVHHRPYPLRRARVGELRESLLAASGIERGEARVSELYSPGVDVEIFGLERLGREPAEVSAAKSTNAGQR